MAKYQSPTPKELREIIEGGVLIDAVLLIATKADEEVIKELNCEFVPPTPGECQRWGCLHFGRSLGIMQNGNIRQPIILHGR